MFLRCSNIHVVDMLFLLRCSSNSNLTCCREVLTWVVLVLLVVLTWDVLILVLVVVRTSQEHLKLEQQEEQEHLKLEQQEEHLK